MAACKFEVQYDVDLDAIDTAVVAVVVAAGCTEMAVQISPEPVHKVEGDCFAVAFFRG